VAIVGASLYWGWSNYESADRWRDRGEALQEELDTRSSNADAVEDALNNAASRGARMADSQQQMAELREATQQTVNMINSCAFALNDLLDVTASGGDPTVAIDQANEQCGAAAANGEVLIQVLDDLQLT
jgi:K+-transporting ATPase c subunit